MVAEYFTAINTAIESLKKLRDVSKKVQNSEFLSILADLSDQLSNTKLEMVELKQQIVQLQEENQELRNARSDKKEKPKIVDGLYQFEGEDGYFCSGCFDASGKKIRLSYFVDNLYQCPVCKSGFSKTG